MVFCLLILYTETLINSFVSRQVFPGALVAAVGSRNKQQVPKLACSLGAVFLTWGEGRVVSRGQAGGVA